MKNYFLLIIKYLFQIVFLFHKCSYAYDYDDLLEYEYLHVLIQFVSLNEIPETYMWVAPMPKKI